MAVAEEKYACCSRDFATAIESGDTSIECGECERWFHTLCVRLPAYRVPLLLEFYCDACRKSDLQYKIDRHLHRQDTTELTGSERMCQTGSVSFVRRLKRQKFAFAKDANMIKVMPNGHSITIKSLSRPNFFRKPILVQNVVGLGMNLPSPDFTLEDVKNCVGANCPVEIIDVQRQQTYATTMGDYLSMFDETNADRPRTRPYNLISLEFSDTPLDECVSWPSVLSELSWVHNYWRSSRSINEASASKFKPEVSKFCLIGMADSYTDFHIDFGGTSVWYHVLWGAKRFFLIEPNDRNLKIYKEWMARPNHTETYLGDLVGSENVFILDIQPGETVLIPSGWIHAVLTPKDSLVFGGNYLHTYDTAMQLKVYDIEQELVTPEKYQFPNFEIMNWHAAAAIFEILQDRNVEREDVEAGLLNAAILLAEKLPTWADRDKVGLESSYLSNTEAHSCETIITGLEKEISKARARMLSKRKTPAKSGSQSSAIKHSDDEQEKSSKSPGGTPSHSLCKTPPKRSLQKLYSPTEYFDLIHSMCGFIVTHGSGFSDDALKHLTNRRGPDSSDCISCRGCFRIFATVLQMRGCSTVQQPLVSPSDNVLVFNGEDFTSEIVDVSNEGGYSDVSGIMDQLLDGQTLPVDVFARIRGPFAFGFLTPSDIDDEESDLWFGRDVLGRRSLILSIPNKTDEDCSANVSLSSLAYTAASDESSCLVPPGVVVRISFSKRSVSIWHLRKRRVTETAFLDLISYLGFEVAVDCSYIAVGQGLFQLSHDFCNSTQDMGMSLDELCEKYSETVSVFLDVLGRAVVTRISLKTCRRPSSMRPGDARISIMFSGGVDSLLLAALTAQLLPGEEALDLFNVAFLDSAPDRRTGLSAFAELSRLYPNRRLRFVSIDVSSGDLKQQSAHVSSLLRPQDTLIDRSVGTALWFAASGRGVDGYVSPARAVISGLGPDELMGGYSRHRTRFRAGGFTQLVDELEMELDRLGDRNCGRDDRLVSDHGRELRLPYLDEDLVRYVNALPLHMKANLSLPPGLGDKLLIRMALRTLGFDESCCLAVKRAIQFGSRIAKQINT